jgi:hypothetical protein
MTKIRLQDVEDTQSIEEKLYTYPSYEQAAILIIGTESLSVIVVYLFRCYIFGKTYDSYTKRRLLTVSSFESQ